MSTFEKCCALPRCNVTGDGLKACSACSVAFYCSREHQVEAFKSCGHKMICNKKKEDLNFMSMVEKANKYYEKSMWIAALPYYGAMLELTERKAGIFHMQCAQVNNLLHSLHSTLQFSLITHFGSFFCHIFHIS